MTGHALIAENREVVITLLLDTKRPAQLRSGRENRGIVIGVVRSYNGGGTQPVFRGVGP